MIENIPQELRKHKAFVIWRYVNVGGEKPAKIPFDPKTGFKADVTNPATWSDYETAVNAAKHPNVNGIGFVLTKEAGLTFIDLDHTDDEQERAIQQKIVASFPGYAEISPSGSGLHIIVSGVIPEGRRRQHIEMYSSERYMTLTGNVWRDEPIKQADHTTLHTLWEELGGNKVNGFTIPAINDIERTSDQDIYQTACAASNGPAFRQLWEGDWQGHYGSQSEADQALCNMLGFYTQNQKQIIRLFHSSALGRRDKAKRRDYIDRLISKALDNAVPLLDFSNLIQLGANKLQADKQAAIEADNKRILSLRESYKVPTVDDELPAPCRMIPPPAVGADFAMPTGLLGRVASYIYSQAPYPSSRIALAGAIGFMSGLCGRAFNVSGAGLNLYCLLVADTASGKEAMSTGISKLVTYTSFKNIAIKNYFGVSDFSSGQA